MPSHFSTIGFPVEGDADLDRIVQQAIDAGTDCPVPGEGQYRRWQVGDGIELWLLIDAGNEIVGLNPYFSGPSRIKIGLTGEAVNPEAGPLEGRLMGWADPPADKPDMGEYPFTFDVPNLRLHSLTFPSVQFFQVAAFAHWVDIFADEETYYRQAREEAGEDAPCFAAESFVPSGSFSKEEEAEDEDSGPRPMAFFTGTVIEARKIVNPVTKMPFHWVSVRTLGGVYDVVADAELVMRPLKPGNILQGEFWLTGRPVEAEEPEGEKMGE